MLRIETPKSDADWARIREICCDAAYGGKGLEDARRRDFFGRFWVGPYQTMAPDWALAARDGDGIIGYLTGCPDTRSFERRRSLQFDPPLLFALAAGAYAWTEDARLFVKRTFGIERPPDRRFTRAARNELLRNFPAHLHINMAARARGKGIGRQLIDAYFLKLRARGVPGVHVHCGAGPVEFYKKAGMSVLETAASREGAPIFVLTKSLVAG